MPKIKRQIVLPYVIYFTTFISYLSFMYEPDSAPSWAGVVMLTLCIIHSVLQLFFEFRQMSIEKGDYFMTTGVIWNLFDIGSSVSTIMFAIVDIF